MAGVTFDTLKFVETLEKAGVSREQAEAFATAVRDSHDSAELASNADLRGVHHEISTLRTEVFVPAMDGGRTRCSRSLAGA